MLKWKRWSWIFSTYLFGAPACGPVIDGFVNAHKTGRLMATSVLWRSSCACPCFVASCIYFLGIRGLWWRFDWPLSGSTFLSWWWQMTHIYAHWTLKHTHTRKDNRGNLICQTLNLSTSMKKSAQSLWSITVSEKNMYWKSVKAMTVSTTSSPSTYWEVLDAES